MYSPVRSPPQQDVIGKMRVSFSICSSEIPESPDAMENTADSHDGCPDHGNAGSGPGDTTANSDYQVFLGFRVPVGTRGPNSFSALPSSNLSDTLSFTHSTRYTGALTESVPPPAGFEWVGYISAPYTHNDGADNTPAQRANFAVDFQLPRRWTGRPSRGRSASGRSWAGASRALIRGGRSPAGTAPLG